MNILASEMLFSGSSPPNKPRREDKRERKVDKGIYLAGMYLIICILDDRTEVQEAVFTRWANSLFDSETVTELRDIVELDFLQSFAELITGHKAVSFCRLRNKDHLAGDWQSF